MINHNFNYDLSESVIGQITDIKLTDAQFSIKTNRTCTVSIGCCC